MYRNTYVEINIDNIKDNVTNIINHYRGYAYYIGVVKGNTYGHGDYIINDLIACGINYLAVSSLEEALSIRKRNKDIPILCMEPINLEYIDICLKNNITITIHDYNYFKELMNLNITSNLNVHLKIDSGMNRLGIKEREEIKEIYNILMKHSYIILEGLFSHFATTGISDKIWDKQVIKFKELVSDIDLSKIPIIHMGRSLTLINHPKIDICNGIRLSIIMYGFDQTPKPKKGLKAKLRKIKAEWRIKRYHISPTTLECPIILKPAFSLYSEIMQIKKVKKNEYVGYGTVYQAKEDMLVGIVPIGYADGFNRRNTGREVVINNVRYPIIGEIGMGIIIVKIDEKVRVYDKVTLIGEGISIREVSQYLKTTVYETMCMLDQTIPRVYKKNGEIVYIEE